MSTMCVLLNKFRPVLSAISPVGQQVPPAQCPHCPQCTSARTWSSRGSSQKAGMYLAHSTSTSSCSFMDSHTSAMLAIFFARMSPLIPETGEVIWGEMKENAGEGWAAPHALKPAEAPPQIVSCRKGEMDRGCCLGSEEV